MFPPHHTCQSEITHFLDIFVETEFKLQVCLGHSPWQRLTDNRGITVARRSAVIFHPPRWRRGRSFFFEVALWAGEQTRRQKGRKSVQWL